MTPATDGCECPECQADRLFDACRLDCQPKSADDAVYVSGKWRDRILTLANGGEAPALETARDALPTDAMYATAAYRGVADAARRVLKETTCLDGERWVPAVRDLEARLAALDAILATNAKAAEPAPAPLTTSAAADAKPWPPLDIEALKAVLAAAPGPSSIATMRSPFLPPRTMIVSDDLAAAFKEAFPPEAPS